jgi:hypothetical protein
MNLAVLDLKEFKHAALVVSDLKLAALIVRYSNIAAFIYAALMLRDLNPAAIIVR